MSAIITNLFRQTNADQFHESFGEANATTYYLFVGRSQPWTSGSGGGSDLAPPTPLDNNEAFAYYRDMVAAKKVLATDVSKVVPRHDWATGTVYDYYRHDFGTTVNSSTVTLASTGGTDPFDAAARMYVKTSDHNVYKCISNNSGAVSTVEPTGTTNTEFNTADGYWWKYMYTLSTNEVSKFLTNDFMAVTTNGTVSNAAVNGEVRHYIIENGGSGYNDGTYTGNVLYGDGTGATFDLTVLGNTVTSVTMTGAGSNYTFANMNIDSIAGIGTPISSAIVTPIISPQNGHGYNAEKELGAFYVMLTTTITAAEGSGDFIIDNDFRRVGLVRDPFDYGTTTISTSTTLSALKSVTFDAVPAPTAFVVDEVLTGGTSGAKGVVASWDSVNRILKYYQTEWTGIDATNSQLLEFQVAETITSSGIGSGVVGSMTTPEINFYSGDIIYVENRTPITRAADQSETVKLIVEF